MKQLQAKVTHTQRSGNDSDRSHTDGLMLLLPSPLPPLSLPLVPA